MDFRTWQTRIPITLAIVLSLLFSLVESSGENQSSITNRKKRKSELEHPMDFRIIGGTDASIKDYPYIASIQLNSNHICGGSILTESFILTAAHCIVDFDEVKNSWTIPDPLEYNIVAGQTVLELGECQFRDVKKIIVHSGYDHYNLKNDIAILEIMNPLEWTKYTRAAELVSGNHEPFETCHFCLAIGWGSTGTENERSPPNKKSEQILQEVDLKPSKSSECEKSFSGEPDLFDSTKLCIIITEGKDTCVGDSGGPLICDDIQYGITSFGLGCAQQDMPGVFTNVSAFRKWIDRVLNESNFEVVSRHVEPVNLNRVFSNGKRYMGRSAINGQSDTRYSFHLYFFPVFVSFQVVIFKLENT